ncbi:hypothetical protein [Brevibacillus laterosporus]|uniref:hypothetical protein n=1 Tax=Brevibacillus laterosporus TaxID=1465 RepID=UPI0003B2315D|nr:hypothetical protein [Brevibacillus laterosporus]ERM16163.1 hypothetical protein P615_05625 [Brevibacillus laterosporus PE36]
MKKILTTFILVVSVAINACTPNTSTTNTSTVPSSDSNAEKHNQSEYFSLTVTNKQNENHFYTYDIDAKTIKEMAKTPDTAQYPLGSVDLNAKSLYYSERDSTGSDQLVKLDLATKKKEKLTTNLFAINYIIPVGNQIIIAAAEKTKSAVQLASYNLQTKKLSFWVPPNDDDTSVKHLMYNPYTKKLYATLYSNQEDETLTRKAAKEQAPDIDAATHRVVEYDMNQGEQKKPRELYKAKEVIRLFSVSTNTEVALIKSGSKVFKEKQMYLFYFDSGKKEPLVIPELSTIEEAYFAPDKQGLFIKGNLKTTLKNNDITDDGPPNGLFYFDLKTHKINEIYSKPDSYINNFILLENSSK